MRQGDSLYRIAGKFKVSIDEIIAWNFFQEPNTEEYRVPPSPYEQHHLALMLDQLRLDFIDCLVDD